MSIPKELKYSKEHEWISVEGNIGTIGITEFAQGELGDLVYVDIDTVGQVVKKDEIFGTVEAVKTTSDLFLPVTGKILEVNSEITESGGDDPGLINSSPYEDGWIVKIEIMDPSELDTLLDSEAYAALVG
ncbi:MAG: glycine cleavage system protein GcvH [Saprospiraceae bacterium]|jgi:glycine cleavage system H protein|uniref:glycine cleavage system protein GcvH n=1 Tax=Candidatus Brachybacter algidus TaxID=2982024 RepID=UPI001B725E6B|nr:glycine cleavage system protein GcvH [Candidatus Brachybacter algidus]MBP7307125.1 glycine cleavage system protein GcvH [Saprospiraceae bacterium]MBK6375032.1 glycine cleavage system protein GcvH [Candidatus Brachybacter algidus]MBK6450097.1 glycine cleavage system protein GcvH [Candidatus Brachybacter algidus]MBK6450442.1 glycine cleavage system protein GcvH [Candidatus Brachybacter algidus]MBK7605219.1 glycine cleavage system protein GcvH [Candidatus Brachybacter algidus]